MTPSRDTRHMRRAPSSGRVSWFIGEERALFHRSRVVVVFMLVFASAMLVGCRIDLPSRMPDGIPLDDAWLDRQCGGENRVSATKAVAWRHRLLPQPKPP